MHRETYYILRQRGTDQYYKGRSEFTPDPSAARELPEAEAIATIRAHPLALDAIEVHPWWTGMNA